MHEVLCLEPPLMQLIEWWLVTTRSICKMDDCAHLYNGSWTSNLIGEQCKKRTKWLTIFNFWYDDYEIILWWLSVQKSWWGRECSNFSWFEQCKAQKRGKPAANSDKSSLSPMLFCYSWTNQNHPIKGFQIQDDGMYYFLGSCSVPTLVQYWL